MGKFYLVQFQYLIWSLLFLGTHQLQSSQTQVLLQLRKQLEYPSQLGIWNGHGLDLCFLPPSQNVNLTCENNSVIELSVVGNKFTALASSFEGYATPSLTLSHNFSMESVVTTLTRLTGLRVLRLVCLGMWGQLPDKIHRLSSLEILDLSSNFLYGLVPPRICTMVKLQSLLLDYNFFNGTVPKWFDFLQNITVLSLRNNRLNGQFPSSFKKIRSASEVYLSGNEIDGKLPDLSGLSNLRVLNLSGNRLSSNLPEMPRSLIVALLGNNSFSGEIPKQYSQLSHLEHLDVSFNMLTGTPPAGLFSLPTITYLNFLSNMFIGSLSVHITCSKKLRFVDLSNNKLKGSLPACLRSWSGNQTVYASWNCLSTDAQIQHLESYCAEVSEMKPSARKKVGVLVVVIGGSLVLICLLGYSLIALYMRCCRRGISEQHLLHKAADRNSGMGFSPEVQTSASRSLIFVKDQGCRLMLSFSIFLGNLNVHFVAYSSGYISETTKMSTQDLPQCRSFSLQELEAVTDNFNKTAFIGEGTYGKVWFFTLFPSFGKFFCLQLQIFSSFILFNLMDQSAYSYVSQLYKGRLRNGLQVAVRCLPSRGYSIRNLRLRLDLLSKLRHPNLVCLLGHCIDATRQDDQRFG